MVKISASDRRVEMKPVKVSGKPRYLWQAVNDAGEVLEFYVTETPDEQAALRFLKRALAR